MQMWLWLCGSACCQVCVGPQTCMAMPCGNRLEQRAACCIRLLVPATYTIGQFQDEHSSEACRSWEYSIGSLYALYTTAKSLPVAPSACPVIRQLLSAGMQTAILYHSMTAIVYRILQCSMLMHYHLMPLFATELELYDTPHSLPCIAPRPLLIANGALDHRCPMDGVHEALVAAR